MHEDPLSETDEATEQDGMLPEEDLDLLLQDMLQKTFGQSPVLATCV